MIPVAEPSLGEEELNNVVAAIKSGWISSKGKFIPEFEEEFARYCGVKYGVATSNGTSALHLALVVLEVGQGDEVIIPSLTFIATANAVRYTGAKPVFVDSHADYWCLDPEKIESRVTKRTKAIIPVHLYGHPCDMDAIIATARRHNLYIIEDAAEAHGAKYKGRRVGSFGNISCFSFYGNKIITTGEGGMCLTDDADLADKMRILKNHGMDPTKRYWHNIIGFNYRMTNMQAAVGVAQLRKIDKFIEEKRKIARWYREGLRELEEKRLVRLHPRMPWADCVYWLYSILVEDNAGVSRGRLQTGLEKSGIETRPLFYPAHTMPPYKSRQKFLNAEEISRKGVSLPSGGNLTRGQVEKVIAAIRRLL